MWKFNTNMFLGAAIVIFLMIFLIGLFTDDSASPDENEGGFLNDKLGTQSSVEAPSNSSEHKLKTISNSSSEGSSPIPQTNPSVLNTTKV